MSMPNQFENQVLLSVFHGQTIPTNSPKFLLNTLTIADDGVVGGEPAAVDGYARVTFGSNANWSVVNGEATNLNAIEFGPATANWGTILSVGVGRSTTIGSVADLWYWNLDTADQQTITAGRKFVLPPGQVVIRTELAGSPVDRYMGVGVENALLNRALILFPTSMPPVATYVGLSRTNPTRFGTGLDEPTFDSAYARIQVPQSVTGWTVNTAKGFAQNAERLQWQVPTMNWGLITYFTLHDAATGGNLLWYAPLAVATAAPAGTAPFILTADLEFALN